MALTSVENIIIHFQPWISIMINIISLFIQPKASKSTTLISISISAPTRHWISAIYCDDNSAFVLPYEKNLEIIKF